MSNTPTFNQLIPFPSSLVPSQGVFHLTAETPIQVEAGRPEISAIGRYLSERLAPATGWDFQVIETAAQPTPGGITLTTLGAESSLGPEGYQLRVEPDGIQLQAPTPAGLFWGLQTLRQLLPAAIESPTPQPGPWQIPAVLIQDVPRFTWRGTMLDVSRHFFSLADIKRYIDSLAYYKLNTLHLHLSDDQGWRLMIESWPNLALHGGSTQVGGGPGGYYTQAQYAQLVAYAQSRHISIVPEIDLPGHTNAALASYPELNKDGQAPPLYTGTNVGFSSLCLEKEITFEFLRDVIRELAALTPGPYLHMGGDETHATSPEDYQVFIRKLQDMVQSHGKRMVGWDEIARCDLDPSTIVQYWRPTEVLPALPSGVKVVMSLASRAYIDMKYDSDTPLGLNWAGYLDVETAYDWDPAAQSETVSESDLLGVEAPLWAETIETLQEAEFMAFPRLAAIAEVGWTPQALRAWESYRARLASHGPRLAAMGVNFYRSPEISWE
jgi:hexosaminidase